MVKQIHRRFARRRREARRAALRAYTVVEVMMALSILSIGATGIVAMQKVTLLGNTNARDLATASAVAAGWIERLRIDGLRWKYLPLTRTAPYTSTQYLQLPKNVWTLPPNGVGSNLGWRAVSDVRGIDADAAFPRDNAFCVNIRLTEIMQDPPDQCGGPVANCPSMLRADVRVYWLKLHTVRDGNIGGPEGQAAFCSGAEIATLETQDDGQGRYHFVYMSSAILRNDR